MLKCQTVPECGPRLRRLDRENPLHIKDRLRLFIPQPLALSLGYFNQHLLSSLWLIVSYLYCGRYQKIKSSDVSYWQGLYLPGFMYLACDKLAAAAGEMNG